MGTRTKLLIALPALLLALTLEGCTSHHRRGYRDDYLPGYVRIHGRVEGPHYHSGSGRGFYGQARPHRGRYDNDDARRRRHFRKFHQERHHREHRHR